MKKSILASIRMLAVMTLMTGVAYPLIITLVALFLFQQKSPGSFIRRDTTIVGSELIGQKFQSDRYFWPRPSAVEYNPIPSGATNFGPTSDTLRRVVEERKRNFLRGNGLAETTPVPGDMLFASGSGIDPHISPQSALLQVERVARARGYTSERRALLEKLVRSSTEGPEFRLFGMARVNVLRLNLAVDDLK
jgi:K+-transporting ATPase ATPase C chain